MSAKKKTYSADFKTKAVLELLSNASTLHDVSGATKAYKDEIEELKESNENKAKALGNTTIERDSA